jgi:biotin carboxyl carrier protein
METARARGEPARVTLDIEVGGRRRRVELERDGHQWHAVIDGRTVTFNAAQTPTGWSLVIGPAEAGRYDDLAEAGRSDGPAEAGHDDGSTTVGDFVGPGFSRASYDATVDGDTVYVGGHAIAARVIDPRAYARRGRGQDAAGSGQRQVKAPMPGRVVKVLVKPGDTVVARQGLIVVEAMKMENELRALADGIVRDVRVREGSPVDAGTILVVLD